MSELKNRPPKEITFEHPFCPSCGADLREVGFQSDEEVWHYYAWEYNGESFECEKSDEQASLCGDNNSATCNDCGAQLPWHEVQSLM